MENLFKDYYYTDTNIYSNNEIWKQIQKDERYNKKIKKKDFDTWLKDQEHEQVHKVKYKPPPHFTHPIIAKPNSYQSDLMFLKEYHKLNKGYDSIINFVEITTKKAFAYPLKSKQPSEVFKAFQDFFSAIDGNIDYLEIDKGTEYTEIIKFCKKNEIEVIVYNNDKNSMSIVERFNRTLRGYIKRTCKDGIWHQKLPKIIMAYNNKEHSATSYSPDYLSEHPKLQIEIRERLIGRAIQARLELKQFKIGDKVRFYKKRSLFGKGGGAYSDSVHTITDIRKNSIFLDDNNNKKYRYYNLLKIGKVDNATNKEEQKKIHDQAKLNYKVARKLAKEQPTKMSVKETDDNLQQILNDDSVGRGKRIKKPNSRYQTN